MATWRQFRDEQPEFAARVRAAFAVRKHATMATLRRDGSPRISGTEVEFGDDDVSLGSMAGARKARDLQRDPRVAVHSPTVDPVGADGSEWPGEAKLAGRAVETGQPLPVEGAHHFRLDLQEVVFTRVADGRLVVESWHEGRGMHVVARE